MFLKRKIDHQQTIFTTHSTTNSPQNNHAEHHVLSKTPCKNVNQRRGKKTAKSPPGPPNPPGQLGRMDRGKLKQCHQF